MPAPIIPLLIGGAAIAVAAVAASNAKAAGPTSGAYELDHNLPPDKEAQVLAALKHEKNGAVLHNLAARLHRRAITSRPNRSSNVQPSSGPRSRRPSRRERRRRPSLRRRQSRNP